MLLQASFFRYQALIIALCVVVHVGLVGWLVAVRFSSTPPAPPPLLLRLIVPTPPAPAVTGSAGGAAGQPAAGAISAPAPPPQVVALPTPVASPPAPLPPKIAPKPKLPSKVVPKAPPRSVRTEPPPPAPKAPPAAKVVKLAAQRMERPRVASSGNVGLRTSARAQAGTATAGAAMNTEGEGSAGSGAGLHGSGAGSAVGDGPAVPTYQPKPAYPAFARRLGHEGKVLVRISVLSSGEVADASVATSSGFNALDEAALATVRRWRFRPAQRGGRAVDATLNVPITFKLETG